MFLVQKVTILEKIDFLYCLISYHDVYYSVLHQNMCFSKVRVLVIVYYFYLLDEIFGQAFMSFYKMLLGYKMFHVCGFDMVVLG